MHRSLLTRPSTPVAASLAAILVAACTPREAPRPKEDARATAALAQDPKLSPSTAPSSPAARAPATPPTWAKESVHPVRFTVPSDIGTVDPTVTMVESVDEGATWKTIGEVATDERYFHWTIPNQGARAKVAVVFHTTTKEGVATAVRRVELATVALGPSTRKAYTWKRVAVDAPFGPRDGAGGIVHQGKMWLLGGWNPKRFSLGCANDVWSSTDGAHWKLEKPHTFAASPKFHPESDWEGRHFAGYHSFKGKMWIVGGDPNQGYYQTDVWSSVDGKTWTRTDVHATKPRIDPNGQPYPAAEWRPVEESHFGLRAAHITGVFHDKLLVIGGQRNADFVDPDWPGAPSKAFDDIWASDDGASFTKVPTVGPIWSARGYVSEAVELGGKLWIIGGGLHDDARGGRPKRDYRNDVWSTSDLVHWETVTDEAPFAPRIWHDVKAFDGRLWVINGYDGDEHGQGRIADNRADVWASTDGVNWYDVSPPPTFVPRHAGTAWVHENSLFVGSGNAMSDRWHADVWRMTASAP